MNQFKVIKTLYVCAIISFACTFGNVLAAPLTAFPGAVGYGSDTIGGRGGAVIEVTNLNASGTGSLREACESSGARIVVFRTGGTIELTSNIRIRDPFLTIAGQSAPGDGITIRGAGFTVTTHDVIIRHIRIRVGDALDGPDPENRDAIQVEGGAYNVVLDHCSFSWAIDETVTFWGEDVRDCTVSHCILSEALYNAIHPKGPHSKGSLVDMGIQRISYIGNLFAHNDERNPKVRFTSGVIVNNVIYDRGYKDVDIESSDAAQSISVSGNVFKKGVSTQYDARSIYIRAGLVDGTQIFVHDNDCSSYNDGSCIENLHTTFNPLTDSPPIWPGDLTAKPSSEVMDWVLENAGATPAARDDVDTRIVAQVQNGSGRIIDSQNEVGGWPTLQEGTAAIDSDHDGMPDTWETQQGFNPHDSSDANGDRDGDGYTNIEAYLNMLAGDLAADTLIVDAQISSISCTNYSTATRTCGAGSQRAYQTIAGAAAVVEPGDIVEIRGGTYAVEADEEIQLTRSGEPGQPITYRGYQSERVVIKGPYDVDSDSDGIRDWDETVPGGDAAGPASGDRGIGLAIYGNHINVQGVRVEWAYKCVEVSGSNNRLNEVIASDCWAGGIRLLGGNNNKVTSSAGFRIRHRSGGGIANSDPLSVAQGHVLYRNLFFNNGRQLPDGALVAPIDGDPHGGGNADGWGASKSCSDDVGGAYSLCRDLTIQENIAWRNADDCYDTSIGGSWIIGNIGYDCGPRGKVGYKMLRDQYEMALSGNIFVGADNADSLNWGMRFRFADSTGSGTESYILHNMTTSIADQFGIGVLSLNTSHLCQARNNLSWSNSSADDYSWNGCTESNNYQGSSPGVVNGTFNPAASVAAAEGCLADAPHQSSVASCWQTLYNAFQNAYRPAEDSPIVDSGVVVNDYHCPLPDDGGQNPTAACRHWVGENPDEGPFEFGITGNPDRTRFTEIGLGDSNSDGDGDGILDVEDNCPTVSNSGQENQDGDNMGDLCDDCPNDADNDADGDGICADADNCPGDANPNQEDQDGNDIGDACDEASSPDQGGGSGGGSGGCFLTTCVDEIL